MATAVRKRLDIRADFRKLPETLDHILNHDTNDLGCTLKDILRISVLRTDKL
jgi:hypothetical protein